MTGRGLQGRRQAQSILLVAILMDALAALILLTPSTTMGGAMMPVPGFPTGSIILAVGMALNVMGIAWMVRILRADPEGGRSSWRAFRRR